MYGTERVHQKAGDLRKLRAWSMRFAVPFSAGSVREICSQARASDPPVRTAPFGNGFSLSERRESSPTYVPSAGDFRECTWSL